MNVKVEFLSLPKITKVIGGKSISLSFSGKTLGDLLNEICNKYGSEVRNFLLDESGNMDMAIKVLLNKSEWLYRENSDKLLNENDQITFMMLPGGG